MLPGCNIPHCQKALPDAHFTLSTPSLDWLCKETSVFLFSFWLALRLEAILIPDQGSNLKSKPLGCQESPTMDSLNMGLLPLPTFQLGPLDIYELTWWGGE